MSEPGQSPTSSPARTDPAFAVARRNLPNSQEAERSILGGLLLYPKSFSAVAEVLGAEGAADFYSPIHGAIFTAMLELDRASKPIDAITVAEQMRANESYGKLRAVNGEAYFAELMSEVVTIENIAFHARMVAGKAMARRMIETAQEIASKGYGEYGDEGDYVDQSQAAIYAIIAGRPSSRVGVRKVLGAVIKSLEKRHENKQAVTGVPAGYEKLDAMTAGFQPSELIIIAARPSMGKTSLVMNAVQNSAIQYGVPALVFSLEMSKESLVERMLCSDAKVDSTRVRSAMLEQRDWVNLSKAASRIAESPIQIDDAGAATLLDIRTKSRQWRSDPNVFKSPDQLGVIVIDYLQLINGSQAKGREQNREREISEISRGLKALAKELRVPVIALSQLNRGVESRADKRPGLADLRESGAIEQDADVIAFIYRDEFYNKESSDKGIAEIIIGKQRSGPTGTVRLAFLNQYTRFESLSYRDDA